MAKRTPSNSEDDAVREFTEEEIKNAIPFSALPESLRKTLSSRARGPQKATVKKQVTIRLSHEVVNAFRATGAGWHNRIDEALKDWLKTNAPS